jgi:hypothetical protein
MKRPWLRLRTIMIIVGFMAIVMAWTLPRLPDLMIMAHRSFHRVNDRVKVRFIDMHPLPPGAWLFPLSGSWELNILTDPIVMIPGWPVRHEMVVIPLEDIAAPLVLVLLAIRHAYRRRKQAALSSSPSSTNESASGDL